MGNNDGLLVKFKFKVGDVLSHRGCQKTFISYGSCTDKGGSNSYWVRDNRTVFMVLSLFMEQCSGGLQIFYRCRPIHPDGRPILTPPGYIDLFEHELEGYDDTRLKLNLGQVVEKK